MAKQIRVDDEVYNELLKLQRPREPLGGIVRRLLSVYALIMAAEPIIRGQHELLLYKKAELEKLHPVD